MRIINMAAVAALTFTGIAAVPAMAESPTTLHFANLEFNAPRDPLLWSSTPLGSRQHTPATKIDYALDQLRAAIPAGTSAADARNRLQAAGSHCDTSDTSAITCRYTDVETRDGEYLDYVVWKVSVPLVNNQVADIKVIRDWYRS